MKPKFIAFGCNPLLQSAIESIVTKERGITITEMIEQDKSISYINRFNYKYLSEESTKFYDKPQSKYHK